MGFMSHIDNLPEARRAEIIRDIVLGKYQPYHAYGTAAEGLLKATCRVGTIDEDHFGLCIVLQHNGRNYWFVKKNDV